jgi:hypothetical protein
MTVSELLIYTREGRNFIVFRQHFQNLYKHGRVLLW